MCQFLWCREFKNISVYLCEYYLLSSFSYPQSGDQIVSVDGTSLTDMTHAEAVDLIRRSYHNKTKDVMEIVVVPK